MKILLRTAAALALLACQSAHAQDPGIRTQRAALVDGAQSITAQIRGDQTVDYVLGGLAGQTLTANLETSNASSYFNLNPPGSEGAAMYIGSTSGGHFEGVLPADGEYTVRVYLMRNAARRNETAKYTLELKLSGTALPAIAAAQDALVPGTPWHASASIACKDAADAPAKQCEAGVIRRGFDGTATLEVQGPDGMKHRILFVKGEPVAADSPEALVSSREGDVVRLSLGDWLHFEIPDVLLSGG